MRLNLYAGGFGALPLVGRNAIYHVAYRELIHVRSCSIQVDEFAQLLDPVADVRRCLLQV